MSKVPLELHTTLLLREFETHNVHRLILEKPPGLTHAAGQFIKLAIDTPELRDKARPFTPVSLAGDGVIELLVKHYPDHANGVTRHIPELSPGQSLRLSTPQGDAIYNGPGLFLAGGTGITPFLAVFREQGLKAPQDSRLVFANRSPADIICEKELHHYFADRSTFLVEEGAGPNHRPGRIDRELLESLLNESGERVYVCGPPAFNQAVAKLIREIGVQPQVIEA